MNNRRPQPDYVMFGQSGLFGDCVDIIHARGGRLKKVVVNLPDPADPNRKTFVERVTEMNRYIRENALAPEIQIEEIGEFRPVADELYVIGFRGAHVAGLRDRLVRDHGIRFDSLVHPRAELSPTASLGEGVIVNAGAVIASWADVGDFCMINRGATIGHDCRISAFANIRPGAHVASNVRIGGGATIGIGATVIEDVTIGNDAYVAAGAVVIADVTPDTRVAGVPARIIKHHDDRQR